MRQKYIDKAMGLLVVVFSLCFNAKAADIPSVDYGELLPDTTYVIPGITEFSASYTPSQSGPARFLWSASPLTLYSSPDHDESSIVVGSHSYTQNGQLMSYSYLEAGVTYYIYSKMTMMETSLIIREGDAKVELVSVSPSLDHDSSDYYGGKFSVSKNYRITLFFSYPVSVGNCLLIAGDERVRITPNVNNATVTFDVYETVMYFYNGGFLKEGDTMTLRLLQVSDALNSDVKYNDNGRLELDFVMADKPAELVETKGFSQNSTENPFLSYYLPEDSAGVMELVFDKQISLSNTPFAQITYGNPENLELGIYSESLSGIIDGNVVSFDFSGKLRRRIDMLPGADDSDLPTAVYVAFTGIYTDDNQLAYTGVLSNPTSFSASFVINELQFTIAADFTPARGTTLKPGDEMEIWVMNGSKIQFDDICIDYMENGESKSLEIGKDNISQTVDPYSVSGDDYLYYFTIPEYSADADSNVSVYMTNIICADGLDHTNDVRGNFVGASSGVGFIDADSDVGADVFDISGKCVLRNATRSQFESLEKGVYIFNGKKIVVK